MTRRWVAERGTGEQCRSDDSQGDPGVAGPDRTEAESLRLGPFREVCSVQRNQGRDTRKCLRQAGDGRIMDSIR